MVTQAKIGRHLKTNNPDYILIPQTHTCTTHTNEYTHIKIKKLKSCPNEDQPDSLHLQNKTILVKCIWYLSPSMTAMPREWNFMLFAQVGQALGKPVQTPHSWWTVKGRGLNSGLIGPIALKNVKDLKKVCRCCLNFVTYLFIWWQVYVR